MNPLFSPRERSERLIAGGRIVLAATSLAALWRDPTEPEKYASIAYSLLVAYVLYAVVIAVVVWRWRGGSLRQGILTHCFDLAFFSTFMYFTSGPSSPFIAYFVFSLVCATLRWQWRGTLWTAVATLSAYAGLGFYFAAVLQDPSFEINRFVIRGVYMAVVAYLLGQLGRHEQRTRREISALASWPSSASGGLDEVLAQSLANAASVHGAPRAAVAWQSAGGARRLAGWRNGRVERSPHDWPDDSWLASDVEGASFLSPWPWRPGREVLIRRDGRLDAARVDPLASELRLWLGEGPTLSAPWSGELSGGRLFVTGLDEATSDDLLLVEISAALVGARIEAYMVLERRRATAAEEERMRLSRDLHDGVLQSLTAIGLRVAAARRLLAEDMPAAEASLADLQRLLTLEQRDLRFLIRDLEPPVDAAAEPDFSARLAELVGRVEQEWQIAVELHADEFEDELAEATERDLYFLVREGLINAARHADARRVKIDLRRAVRDRASIVIEDDGRGFPFEGRHDLAELTRLQLGPRSLRERVTSLGGDMTVASSPSGARIEIEVPV